MSHSNSGRVTQVALIGRPNVGKSSLFNILTRSRKAVVKDQPGVTRDVLIEPADWWGNCFDVFDTGGITDATDVFSPLIKEQVLATLEGVDLVVVIMDGRTGLLPEDRDIVRIAKESGKPFIVAVNKIDQMHEAQLRLSEFYEFGIDLIPCSFEQRLGVDEIVEWIKSHSAEASESTVRQGVRLAVVGKPNVGKSSLCNYLLQQKRSLVSDQAGTTVDAVETQFTYADRDYILVDTAGLRRSARRKNTDDGVEILSAFKSQEAIERADIVLLLVDATEGPSDQDAKIVQYANEKHKPIIMVANKIDLAREIRPEPKKWFRLKVAEQFHFFPDIQVVFTSALSGTGVKDLFACVDSVWSKIQLKISTSELNNFFYETIRQAPAPVWGTRNVKFYYLTQTEQKPPSFIAFANHPQGVTPAYRRFLTNKIKERWSLQGVPVRMFIMKSGA
ncbi:MAG: ribosome biogenesis GTPase Der [Pseudobdellovibrionaceae bacterium]|nr:ribosome biogenesis GTPase Der [Bdellovibrionales bacterium]USN48353.1 MAG: ribosome biogenesis GTPase Der [Pseudobdellovibrionaceae bacterium]